MTPDASWIERVRIGHKASAYSQLAAEIERSAADTRWYLPRTVTGLVWFKRPPPMILFKVKVATPAEEP